MATTRNKPRDAALGRLKTPAQIAVRWTETEAAIVRRAADALGLTVSAFIRSSTIGAARRALGDHASPPPEASVTSVPLLRELPQLLKDAIAPAPFATHGARVVDSQSFEPLGGPIQRDE